MGFKTKYGHFKYQIIFFDLFKAFTDFQIYINKNMAKKLNIFMIIYLNNFFIYIKILGRLILILFDKF